MARIPPTVGRMVWFHPGLGDSLRKNVEPDQPLSGQIAHVHPYTDVATARVNLCVLDIYGNPHARVNVPLIQEDQQVDTTRSFCRWMPYELGQAAKTEQAQAELIDRGGSSKPGAGTGLPGGAGYGPRDSQQAGDRVRVEHTSGAGGGGGG